MMSDTQATPTDAPDDDAPVEIADKPREPTPYEKKLRTEARQHRLRALEAERSRDSAIAAARAESERAIAEAVNAANERIVRAELKAHAIRAGIVDLDGLKLLDLSGVKLSPNGEVEGTEALIASLKAAKPYLFGAASSSSTAKPPSEQTPEAKHALNMSAEEWRVARAAILKRR
jgi:hypothetical protein